jgi:hypothetical protein
VSLRNFLLFGIDAVHRMLSSNILNLYSSLLARDKVLYPYNK